MGADIHIHAFKRNEILATDMAHGMRNYEWFDALSGANPTDFDESYIFFPDSCNRIDVKEICPKMDEIIENDINSGGFYGLNIYSLRDLIVWAESYKPNLKAGWVTRWEKWAYENKIFHFLSLLIKQNGMMMPVGLKYQIMTQLLNSF